MIKNRYFDESFGDEFAIDLAMINENFSFDFRKGIAENIALLSNTLSAFAMHQKERIDSLRC